MKKSRIIALLTAALMIMSVIPASAAGYFVDESGALYEKNGENLISNPGFEEGLTGLTQNDEYYEVTQDEAHSGSCSLKAIKSTKGEGAITAYFAVENPSDSYYLSFWYMNTDTVARRPRVTFAFTDSSKTVPAAEDDFTKATNAWIGAGVASNDQNMPYSYGDWVQYSTVIKGNGSHDACAYVVLNIYGLTKDVSFVDDFELYNLTASAEYGDVFAKAIKSWEKVSMPGGSLAGTGTIKLPTNTGVDGVSVKWLSSSESVNADTGEYASGIEEELVILTARLYVNGHYDDIYYDYEYPYILKSMFEPYGQWLNDEVFAKMGERVSGNVSLPKSHSIAGYPNADITWTTSDEDALTSDGIYIRPEVTENVDITATVMCAGYEKEYTKRVTVLGTRGDNTVVGNGLIMYYDFDMPSSAGEGNIKDNSYSSNSYDATYEGITFADGYAKFSGSGSTIKLPSHYGTELGGSYTVSMWVKLDESISYSANMYRFFDFGGETGNSHFVRYIPATGQLGFMDRGTSGGKDNFQVNTYVSGFANTWKHIALVYDLANSPGTATMYIDGVAVADSNGNNTLTQNIKQIASSSSNTGYIGRTQWNNESNPDFKGLMDDIRIYNRAVSADEIRTLYDETRVTASAPITIKFVDVNGETIKDDVKSSAPVGTSYEVPSSLKSIPTTTVGDYRYVYNFVSSRSIDSILVSGEKENICTLVFKAEKVSRGANLIDNPSFENGTTGWTTTGYTKQIVDGQDGINIVNDASAGSKALQLTSAKGSTSAGALSTKWSVEPNTEYVFSFDIKRAAVAETTGYLEFLNSSGGVIQTMAGENPGRVWTSDHQYFPVQTDWSKVEYKFKTPSDTAEIGVKIAWFDSANPVWIDNFVLKEPVNNEEDPDDTEKVPVIIRYLDTQGNKIKDDYETSVSENTLSYTVPSSLRTIEDVNVGSIIYKYALNTEATGDGDTVSISILNDNICTLVYDVVKADRNKNLVPDSGFKDSNGNFSWGTWQSPETGNYFKDRCDNWFYVVNRDTNESVLYGNSLNADDYALGTRWNDGITGLCSLANFIPVKKGKTYIVSYDYKHKTSGTDGAFISTSFQRNKTLNTGASGLNNPKNVSTEWQTNSFTITAPSDGYIYFHFSWVGSGGPNGNNDGNGPYWYFDNFEVLEGITFENEMTYADGQVSVVAEDGITGYIVQAIYNEEGALTEAIVSDKYTFSKETPVVLSVKEGAKVMVVKDLTSLEPILPAIMAK